MSNRRNANEPEPTGEIHLRQTVQMTVADQTRTLEIAVTLPSGASADEIDRTIRQAEVGMRGITEQLDRHVAALKDASMGHVVDAGHAPDALLAEPTAQPNSTHAATDVPHATEPVAATPAPAEAPPAGTAKLTTAAFIKAAKELGYDSQAATKALGEKSLTGLDLVEALARLRAIAAAAQAAPARGFAEEIGPYDAESDGVDEHLMGMSEPDDADEPDFGPVPEEHAHDGFAPEAEAGNTPTAQVDAEAMRRHEDAVRRLRDLRSGRGGGPPATPEMRQVLFNCVISRLGSELAQTLVTTIWNLAPGEKLNAARTRQLIEWSKEDDNFEETAAAVIALARQPAPTGE